MLSACVASKIDQHPVLAGKSSLYCRRLKIFTLPAPTTTPGNNESSIYFCGINAAVYIWWGCAAGERTACESNQRFVISAAPTINTQVVKFASKSLSLLFCSLWLCEHAVYWLMEIECFICGESFDGGFAHITCFMQCSLMTPTPAPQSKMTELLSRANHVLPFSYYGLATKCWIFFIKLDIPMAICNAKLCGHSETIIYKEHPSVNSLDHRFLKYVT